MSKFRNYWLGLPIGSKMKAFILLLLLVVLIAAGFNIYTIQFSVVDISNILEEISLCENAQDAMTNEEAAFQVFVRDPSVESLSDLNKAAVHSFSALSLLPYDYEEIGAERFAWTWRVKNTYQNYSTQRDLICASLSGTDSSVPDSEQEWVDQLYQVYDMQSYLSSYLQSLSQLTVGYASDVYDLKYPMIQSIPYFQAIFYLLLILVSLSFVGYLTRTILTPIEKLASASRSISQGQLEETDIQVSNRDELGELVDSFNRMKHATKKNIQTMEKRLETTRMDLLQSQIKPHFLFNTLNTISGMAELEDAEKTDSMIRSLSRLFRYNLHTTDQFVSFTQELEVARDYLYLQQMRFGDRVQYELPDPSAPESASFSSAMIPVFLLQPLVENAVIHGIAKKEQGGKITISAGQTDGAFQIRVSDTGVGMDPETLQGLIAALRGDPPDVHVGIGIGNLYKRLETLYGPGSMQISSTAGKGTQVDITIPLGM